MTTKSADSSAQALQGESCPVQLQSPQPGLHEHQVSRARNQVFKSGYLFLSSKGIGWTSWKKRWFILTRTSLVFFRSDPSAAPQKGAEVNLTLGGIDLNNSGSVEVKADKKLLTVFFPDGRDGRAFTLKAETLDDLYEWKTALESALAQAPSATVVTGQNGILKSEQADAVNGSSDQQKDRQSVKSMVIGRPILLALEDIDGSPSFLEKALRFIEDHGIRVEGILRQAADVEEVHRRVREYERGKTEFSPEEDAHVIADCVKYVLRELPSSPVPASCCNALLEAFRTDRNNRLNAMRAAILDTFPEPNRKLLQRMLLMMQTVASNKAVNRMSTSAVAACMAPLLLRPLLAGDCVLENTHMDVAGDGSFQLLQAAAAANHAQAIIITLLDEYENIFGEGSVSPDLFSDSDESGSQSEEATEDDDMYEDDDQDYESDEHASDDHGAETDNDYEHSVSETCSYSGDHGDSDSYDDKHSERRSSVSQSPERDDRSEAIQGPSSATSRALMAYHDNNVHKVNTTSKLKNENSVRKAEESNKPHRDVPAETSSVNHSATHGPSLGSQALSTKIAGSVQGVRHPRWGRTSARKNLSMESIDFSLEEEDEIRELEAAKNDLQNQIDEEVSGNAILHASLEQRKKALHERRLALEKDVARLQEQLQKERDLRAALESGLVSAQGPVAAGIDETTRIELEEIALAEENFNNVKQRLDDLGMQLNQQRELNAAVMFEKKNKQQEAPTRGMPLINKKDNNSRDSSQHLERSSSSEGQQTYFPDEADRDNEKQNESSYSSNKNQVQQSDSILNSNSRYGGVPSNPSSAEPAVSRPVSSSGSKKSRAEGSNSTTSALSKLTTRLNFLKERRTQIANELQNIDKTRVSPQPSPGKAKGSDSQQNANKDKNQASEGGSVQVQEDSVPQSSDRGVTTEGGSHSNQDGYKRGSSSKHDGASFQNPDKGRKPEVQSAQNFDRGKSEGHSSSRNNADKSRRADNPARTSSR